MFYLDEELVHGKILSWEVGGIMQWKALWLIMRNKNIQSLWDFNMQQYLLNLQNVLSWRGCSLMKNVKFDMIKKYRYLLIHDHQKFVIYAVLFVLYASSNINSSGMQFS
jgi:hypothetical protein